MGHHLGKITSARLAAWDSTPIGTETRNCARCDREFVVQFGPSQINCSAECSAAWRKQKERQKAKKQLAVRQALARCAKRCKLCSGSIDRGYKYCRSCVANVQYYIPRPLHPCTECGAAIIARWVRCTKCASENKRKRAQEYYKEHVAEQIRRFMFRYRTEPMLREAQRAYSLDRRNRIRAAWLIAQEMGIAPAAPPIGDFRKNEEAGLRYATASWSQGICQSSLAFWCRPKHAPSFPEYVTLTWTPTRKRRIEHLKMATFLVFDELGQTNEGVNNGRA